MFIKIMKLDEQKELLLNVDHITKIEVEYAVQGEVQRHWKTSLQEGDRNPESKRCYTVHIGGEVLRFLSNPDDPVVKVIEDIYKAAVKG